MKLTIDNIEYNLDVDEAIRNKILVPIKTITKFNVGDVFVGKTHAQVMIVQPIWETMDCIGEIFGFVGYTGGVYPYLNFTKLFTYNEIIEYLNQYKLKFVGNINEVVNKALKDMCGNNFCS